MAARIHSTAVVEDGAELGADVEIGAFAFVGAGVRLGARTRLHHHASVEGNTHLGEACEIFPYANIGGKTQDLKYKGGNPGVRIGARNVFREYFTVHAATNDGDFTTVGDDNTFLAYGHIAHDCVVGSHVVASNGMMLAGHVTVEDHVVIGGYGDSSISAATGRTAASCAANADPSENPWAMTASVFTSGRALSRSNHATASALISSTPGSPPDRP